MIFARNTNSFVRSTLQAREINRLSPWQKLDPRNLALIGALCRSKSLVSSERVFLQTLTSHQCYLISTGTRSSQLGRSEASTQTGLTLKFLMIRRSERKLRSYLPMLKRCLNKLLTRNQLKDALLLDFIHATKLMMTTFKSTVKKAPKFQLLSFLR